MLIITNINGESLPLIEHSQPMRKRGIDGTHTLSFNVRETDNNSKAFKLIENESIITLHDNTYRIKKINQSIQGDSVVLQVHALHTFFDTNDHYCYEVTKGVKVLSLHGALTQVLNGTGYTFTIHDDFDGVSYENFGNDWSLALFNKIKVDYGFEFIPKNKHIDVYKQIGKTDGNQQMRWRHNIQSISSEIDTTGLTTYIQGVGARDEETDEPIITAEYTSAMADIYGIRHAKPVDDKRYSTYDGLLDRLKRDIHDKVDVSYTIEYAKLQDTGANVDDLDLGDEAYLIHEKLDTAFKTRVVEVIDYPLSDRLKPIFTISSKKQSMIDRQVAANVDKKRQEDKIDKIETGQSELDKAMEQTAQAVAEVEQAMIEVDREMDRIENEVIPEVEQVVEDTKIPSQVEPPYPIPNSKMWSDTSVDPPRMMRWSDSEQKWVVLAPTEDEINEIVQVVKDEAVQQGIEYTDAELLEIRQDVLDSLDKKLDVEKHINDLNDMAEQLKKKAESIDLDNLKDDYNSTVVEVLDEADKLGQTISEFKVEHAQDVENMTTRITDAESLITQSVDTITLQVNELDSYTRSELAPSIDSKVDTSVYTEKIAGIDIELDGITSSVSNVTKTVGDQGEELRLLDTRVEQTENSITQTVDRLTSAEDSLETVGSTIEQHADLIEQRVTKTEFDNLEIGGRNLFSNHLVFEFEDESGDVCTSIQMRIQKKFPYHTLSQHEIFQASFKVNVKIEVVDMVLDPWSVYLPNFSDNPSYVLDTNEIAPEGGVDYVTLAFKFSLNNGRDLTKDIFNSMLFQLEKGNKATDYRPAPEDTDDKINDLSSTITKYDTRITQTEKDIRLAATKEELSDTADSMRTQMAAIDVKADGISQTVSDVQADLDGLEIGGRNLVPNSDFSDGKGNGWSSIYGVVDVVDGVYIKTFTESEGASRMERTFDGLKKGTYTLTINAVLPMNMVWRNFVNATVISNDVAEANLENYKTYSVTFEVIEDGNVTVRGYLSNVEIGSQIKMDWFTLYEGNKVPIDWSPAPEDVDDKIDVLDGRVKVNETRITQLPNEIDLAVKEGTSGLVGKTNVLSSINLSTEGVKIQGNKVDIQGLISLINADGTTATQIDGAKITTGSIVANRLNINNIFGNSAVIAKIQSDIIRTTNLSATRITTGTLDASKISVENLSASKIKTGELDASLVRVTNISATEITAGYLDADLVRVRNIDASEIKAGTIEGIDIKGVNIMGANFISKRLNNSLTIDHASINIDNDNLIWDTEITGKDIVQIYRRGAIGSGGEPQKPRIISTLTPDRGLHVDWYDNKDILREKLGYRIMPHVSNGGIQTVETVLTAINPIKVGVSGTDAWLRINNPGVISNGKISIRRSGEAINLAPDDGGDHNFISFRKRDDSRVGFVGVSSASYADTLRFEAQLGDAWIRGYEVKLETRLSGANLYLGRDGSGAQLWSPEIYKRPYSSAPNVVVTSYGTLGRSTSASKYKLSIENQFNDAKKQLNHSKQILDLSVSSWFDKTESEAVAKECETNERYSDDSFKLKRHVGLIAEAVESVGLQEHVTYGDDGDVEGIEYDRLWIHLIPVIKDQQTTISKLTNKINKLEESIN